MTAISVEAAILTVLVVHIQFLVAVVIVFITAAGVIADVRYRISAAFPACLISFSVFPCSAHALISFHCVFGMVATCQPMPSSAVALS